jgi:cell division protease FtsH
MSDKLGPMVYGENEGEVFLGRSVTTHKNMSEKTMQTVDAEVRRIVDEQYAIARKLIEANKDKIEAMTQALLEWETIDSDQINDIMEGRPPRPPKPPQSTTSSSTSGESSVKPDEQGEREPSAPQEIVKETD